MNTVQNITYLKNLTIPPDNYAKVLGYDTPGDGGGGDFYWDTDDTTTNEDGGTIFKSAVPNTTGRWKRLYSGAINVKWFGAKGDGITNDTISIKKTTTFANIYFPAGKFKIYEGINYGLNTIIKSDGAVIDASEATLPAGFDGYVLGIIGPAPVFLGPAQAPVAGDNVLTTESTITVVKDEVLILYNPEDYSYSKYRAYYREGEFVQVRSNYTGNSIPLKGVVIGERYGNSTNIYKVFENNVVIEGITIKAPVQMSVAAIKIAFATSGAIRSTFALNAGYAGISLTNVYNFHLSDVRGYMDGEAVGGTDYGLVISNSQSVTIENSSFTGTRHAITTGGSNDFSITNRFIYSGNCEFRSSAGIAAYDHHGNAEYCGVINSTIIGGVTLGGRCNRIYGCDIFKDGNGNYAAIYLGETLSIDHHISSCNVVHNGIANNGGLGLFIGGNITSENEIPGCLKINENQFTSTRAFTINNVKGIAVTTHFDSQQSVNNCSFDINNNIFKSPSSNYIYYNIYLRNSSTNQSNILVVNISGNKLEGICQIQNTEKVLFASNSTSKSMQQALLALNSTNVVCSANIASDCNQSNASSSIFNAVFSSSNCQSFVVTSNSISGTNQPYQSHGISCGGLSDLSTVLLVNNNNISGYVREMILGSTVRIVKGLISHSSNPEALFYAPKGTIVAVDSGSTFIKNTTINSNTGWIAL